MTKLFRVRLAIRRAFSFDNMMDVVLVLFYICCFVAVFAKVMAVAPVIFIGK